MDISHQIALLIDRGLTQVEIARRIGITQSTVSRLARGEHADTRSSTARKLSALVDEYSKQSKACGNGQKQ